MAKSKPFIVVFTTFAVIIPTLMAHVTDSVPLWSDMSSENSRYDEHWTRLAKESLNHTLKAYHPEPEKIVSSVNKAVHETLHAMNGTRRQLASAGGCVVTNPIDRCWRCNKNWANNRKRLADCGVGFGKYAKGGKDGEFYVVTDDSDNAQKPKPGTLRFGVIQRRPLWIIFSRDMKIRLQQELIMQSDKTIDGRGAKVYITGGAGFTLQYIRNVIIHGIHIFNIGEGSGGLVRDSEDHFGIRTKSDGDGISIFGSQNIWVDHVTMSRCFDGLIDVIEGSTAISITNGYFTDHNEVMLFGARDSATIDEKMQVTVAFNHFGVNLMQRMPRCRFGYIHVVNNDYTKWHKYAIGGSSHPTVISQGNRFIAPDDRFLKQATRRETVESIWKNWDWISEDDYFLNGAFFVPSGDQNWVKKHPQISDGVKAAKGINAPLLTQYSGALPCIVGRPC